MCVCVCVHVCGVVSGCVDVSVCMVCVHLSLRVYGGGAQLGHLRDNLHPVVAVSSDERGSVGGGNSSKISLLRERAAVTISSSLRGLQRLESKVYYYSSLR